MYIQAAALATNSTLLEIYLDHTSIGVAGERLVAAGLQTNPYPNLKILTGFRLGYVLARIGQASLPQEVEGLTNEQTLDFLRIRRQQQQQQHKKFFKRPLHSQKGPAQGGEEVESQRQKTIDRVLSDADLSTSLGTQVLAREGTPAGVAIPAALTAGLKEVANQPFDPTELFALHQHYFSPPAKPSTIVVDHQKQQQHHDLRSNGARKTGEGGEDGGRTMEGGGAGGDPALSCKSPLYRGSQVHPRPACRSNSMDELPPTKRHCGNATKTRIGHYPRLKAHIDGLLKAGVRDSLVLTYLRQIRFLETFCKSDSNSNSTNASYQGIKLPDFEVLLLDHFQ